MHVMELLRPVIRSVVFLSVSMSVTRLRPAKTAERIGVLCGVETTKVGPRNIVLDGGPPTARWDSMRPSPNYFVDES